MSVPFSYRSLTRHATAAAGLAVAGCASAPHIVAYQQARLAPAPRTLAIALEDDEKLPFGIARDAVVAAASRAGFIVATDRRSNYRLYLTAAVGASGAASFLPPGENKRPPDWVARADSSWRARAAGGSVTRVTAVLIEVNPNREVWRGTGTYRTADSATAARDLTEELLAKLPRG